VVTPSNSVNKTTSKQYMPEVVNSKSYCTNPRPRQAPIKDLHLISSLSIPAVYSLK